MSTLESIRTLFFKPAKDMIYGRLEPEQVPAKKRLEPIAIKANKAYVSIVLRSLRIDNVRILWTKLYGVLHSFIELPVYQTEKAQFNVVTVPDQLKNISASNLHLVITRDIPLLNKMPYRGDRIITQMGLFAVKSDNLLDKFLTLLGEISNAAGVNSVRQAMPFVGPIAKGVELVFGVSDQSTMLVGLDQNLEAIPGHYAVTNIKLNDPKNPLALKDLTLDDGYHLCKDGKPLENCSYFVFTIEADENRETWFDIPELGTAYSNLHLSIKSGTPKSIKESYEILAKAILSSPDLLIGNAKAIAKDIYEQEVKDWMPEEKAPEKAAPPTTLPPGFTVPTTTLPPGTIMPPIITTLDIPPDIPSMRKRGGPPGPDVIKPELIAALGFPKKLSKEDIDAAKKIKFF